MDPPPGPEFADALADLPAADLAGLVAAAHEARGWTVERAGTEVLATPPRADRPRRLVVRAAGDDTDRGAVEGEAGEGEASEGEADEGKAGEGEADEGKAGEEEAGDRPVPTAPAGADRLVVPTRAPDAGEDVLDAADVRAMVVHALDPADRARLCRRFFDCDPEAFRGGPSARDTDGGDTPVDDADDREGPDERVEHADSDTPVASGETVAAHEARGTDTDRETGRGRARPPDEAGAPDATDATDATGVPDATDATDADRPDERETGGRRWRRSWSPRQAALLGAAVALVLAGVVTAGPTLVGDAARPAGGANATATDERADVRTGPSIKASFPPGVGAGGVTDAAALAEAHARVLSGRSYRIHIVHREYADGRLRGVAREHVVVADADHYRSRVRTNGTVEHATTVVGESSTYANGSQVYLRPTGGLDVPESAQHRRRMVGSTATPNRFVDRTRRYVRWYLSVEKSRILGSAPRDGTTTLWVALSGDPWPGSTNVTGVARVDERGLVRAIRREYSPAGSPSVRVTVTVRITPGPVTVTRPAWVEEANETATRRPPTPTPRPIAGSQQSSLDRTPTIGHPPRIDGGGEHAPS